MRCRVYGDDMSVRSQRGRAERVDRLPLDLEYRHLAGLAGNVKPTERAIECQNIRLPGHIEGRQYTSAGKVQHEQLPTVVSGKWTATVPLQATEDAARNSTAKPGTTSVRYHEWGRCMVRS